MISGKRETLGIYMYFEEFGTYPCLEYYFEVCMALERAVPIWLRNTVFPEGRKGWERLTSLSRLVFCKPSVAGDA